jgi:5-formyltetrahydrofolate cyclo-ligase
MHAMSVEQSAAPKLSELPPAPCSQGWPDIREWRKQARQTLISHRLGMGSQLRREQGERAKGFLRAHLQSRRLTTVGLYWPMRGEIDIHDLARKLVEAGVQISLPVVVTKSAPVEFWRWQPGMPMSKGIWNIPIPQEREVIEPEVLIVPLVGFDPANYRLGYGGGYYDRTIAAARQRPLCIGFGYAASQLSSICPQPHDVPMDIIITDAGEIPKRDLSSGVSTPAGIPRSSARTRE